MKKHTYDFKRFSTNESIGQALPLIRDLNRALDQAKEIAREIGLYAQSEESEGVFGGTEAQDLAIHLEEIFAAFLTGDPNDDTYNDMIFKRY